ncbi:MAG: head-tail adaptor protein [Pseudomonadota bacterium]
MKTPVLTRPLVLEEPQQVPDGAGGYTLTWTALGTLWADVRARSGSETAGNLVTVSTVSYRITVRAAPVGAPSRPKPEQRLVDGSRIFQIHAVTERDPDGRYLVCYASEEVVT